MKITIKTTWRYLWAARQFASDDETRFVLNGVYVEIRPEQTLLVATDGRKLCVLNCPQKEPMPDNVSFVIRKDAIDCFKDLVTLTIGEENENMGYEMRYLDPEVTIIFDTEGHGVSIVVKDVCFDSQSQAIDHQPYPKWRQTIPTDFKPIGDIALGQTQLDAFCKVSKILRQEGLVFRFTESRAALAIGLKDCPNFFAVLMPYRHEEDLTKLGAFIKPL